MRELELIDALARRFAAPGAPNGRTSGPDARGRVLRGIGDDAAVLRARPYLAVSVDAMVDGVHFRTDQLTSAEIGHRALAGALSDLAAMGAEPGEAFLSLALPTGLDEQWLSGLAVGAAALADACGVTIAGGDVTGSDTLVVSVTVLGWAEDPAALIGRSGARPGDLVGVTGSLGGSAAGLLAVEGLIADPRGALRERYARPRPRLDAGRRLSGAGVSAMIDLSDGLATDARHLAAASGVRVSFEVAALPLAEGVEAGAAVLDRPAWELAATGGEDYELLFSAPSSSASEIEASLASVATTVSWIGQIEAGPPSGSEVRFDGVDGRLAGFEHHL